MTKRQSEVTDSVESVKKQKTSTDAVEEENDNINIAADNVAETLNAAIAEKTAEENDINKLADEEEESKETAEAETEPVAKAAHALFGQEEEEEEEEPGESLPATRLTPAEASLKLVSSDPVALLAAKRSSHKEVERRRRQTINNAIQELQDLVPTAHTNKAQIIRKSTEYIKKLKEKEENLVNKWTLEKIITDQAISELANSNEKLKSELEKAYREIEHHKNVFENFIALVSKQENSDEITTFLSTVNTLFIEGEEEDEEEKSKDDAEKEASEESKGKEDKEETEV